MYIFKQLYSVKLVVVLFIHFNYDIVYAFNKNIGLTVLNYLLLTWACGLGLGYDLTTPYLLLGNEVD